MSAIDQIHIDFWSQPYIERRDECNDAGGQSCDDLKQYSAAHMIAYRHLELGITVGASRKSKAKTSTGSGRLLRDSTVVSSKVRWISGTATLGMSRSKCLAV